MRLPWVKASEREIFSPPAATPHRGFAYLDDDIIINSLSALESGKVDEVVEKINLAQEGGMSVGLKVGVGGTGATASADTKSSESLQAEVIRRRTRFSIFELWYSALEDRRAIGRFEGWGERALDGVNAGHIVEVRGRVAPVAIQTAFRMFLWYANEVREKNPIFKDVSIEPLQQAENVMKFLRGKRAETSALMVPLGNDGPKVGAFFRDDWIIEPVGRWNGTFTLVAQVEEVLTEGSSWQSIRLLDDAPLTPLEESTVKTAVAPLLASFKGSIGVEVDEDSIAIQGPALILRPVAMFR
ncbi:DUF6414 family protein [Cellulosimicrobium cellulans]|uniref:DUF6414 family protein n=1 Tax=Cellulosimicrobium cellulans TaxID=1710 RepID=UPI00301883A8